MFPQVPREPLQYLTARVGRASVGIDLGRRAVRVVTLRRVRGDVRVMGLASAVVDPDAPVAAARETVREAVREACRLVPWRPRRVVTAVPAGAVLLRRVEVVAAATADDIDDAVERELRGMAVPLASLRVVWTPLDDGGSQAGRRREVLVVAVRREAVLARQHLLAAAGLGRSLIDVDAFAALRAASPGVSSLGQTGRPSLLVDAGSESLRVLAWPAGQPPLLHVVPVPREADTAGLAVAVAGVLAELRGALPELPGNVLLCGGRALPPGVAAALESATGLSCSLADPFAAIGAGPGDMAVPAGASAALWATACGLALRGLA